MIVGVDVSSRRIDLAWIENNQPQRWHQILEGKELIDRLRSIRVEWPSDGQVMRQDVTEVCIEMPFGRSRISISALMATVGVVTRQAPPWARVAWPSSGELRAAIGAPNKKDAAHYQIRYLIRQTPVAFELDDWDEHELDALTACIGWTRILQAQDAA